MLKLSAENQEEFERQLELAGFIAKWGNDFLTKSINRTYNSNSKTNVSSYFKASGQNFETVDDIIAKINMTDTARPDERVVIEQKTQGFAFNPNDALDEDNDDISEDNNFNPKNTNDAIKEDAILSESQINDSNLKRKRNDLDTSIG